MFEYKKEYSWLTNICLNLTDACPLACKYCFVEQHPHYMPLEVAKSAVNFILANLEKKRIKNPEERASITYFGGEPTVMWDEVIVPLTTWVKENDYPIDFTMTTNGVLLNKERIQFLKDNHIVPLLSIDGAKETQDYNRPRHDGSGSFDAVSAIIPDLLEAFPNTTFRATIWPEMAHHTFENYIFAIEQGFKNVYFMPDCRHLWTEEQEQVLLNELDKIFELHTILYRKNIQPITFSSITDMYDKVIQSIQPDLNITLNTSRNIFRCGLATTTGAIGYDGSIYGCQEQPSKDNKNIFYIGNIDTGINQKRHSALLQTYSKQGVSGCEDQEFCKNCLLRKICLGFNCPSTSYDLFKNTLIDSRIHCLWNERMYANCFTMTKLLLKEENTLFINTLKKGGEK